MFKDTAVDGSPERKIKLRKSFQYFHSYDLAIPCTGNIFLTAGCGYGNRGGIPGGGGGMGK